MKRPQSVKPDNLFLSSGQALREKRVSIVFSLIFQCLLFLTISFGVYAWMVNVQFKLAMQQQADAVGQSLLNQTADRATELLAIDDKLGLNILLGSLAKNPLVAEVVINDAKGRELFRAGLKQISNSNKGGLYREPLIIQKETKGELQLRLNVQQFQLPWVTSIERAIIIAGILLLVGLVFSFRLGRKIISPVMQLREWLRDPFMPAPAVNRQDEIGDLARDLQVRLISPDEIGAYYAQFIESAPEPEAEPEPEKETRIKHSVQMSEDSLSDTNFDIGFLEEITGLDTVEEQITTDSKAVEIPIINDITPQAILPTVQTAVLFIRLGGQDKLRLLPKERLINLLQRYRDCLDQTVRLYHGEIHTLSDGSSLVLFHSRGSEVETYLFHAICCGELMRGLSHELQVELADTNITLLLQLALAQGTELLGLTPSELLDNDTVKTVKGLADNSRNLLLIDQTVATDTKLEQLAKVRALANPADTYCIERVMEPYAEILEKQLRNMRNTKL